MPHSSPQSPQDRTLQVDIAASTQCQRGLGLGTIHHLINFTLASVENVPVVPAVLDKGHQSKRTRQPAIGASGSGQY